MPTKTQADTPNDAGPAVFGYTAVTTTENYLLMAGLLADKPQLRTAALPEGEWQTHLDEYAQSERS